MLRLFLNVVIALLLVPSLLAGRCAHADMAVPLENAPGVVYLPDLWRPIPRAEILEARERAAQFSPAPLPPLPEAAFQRLPTLQWFSLPHALVFWQPAGAGDGDGAGDGAGGGGGGGADAGAGGGGAGAGDVAGGDDGTGAGLSDAQPAADLVLSEQAGRSPGGVVHLWHCTVTRPDGRFRIELLTRDADGRALILGLAEGLRAARP